jgi:hypothetical protein
MERLVVDVRVVQHGFGGNASDVQASPAEGSTLLYTRGLIEISAKSTCARGDESRRTLRPSCAAFMAAT